MHGARGGAPEGKTQWKLPAWRPLEENNRALEIHQIATLIVSLSGAKRTCVFALHMSAFDPKRTF
jgi:hypothetical protein